MQSAFLLSREVVIVANEKNLKKLSPKEAREYGAKGGKASVESRRRRKSLRESMNTLLEMPISNQRDFNKAIKLVKDNAKNFDNRAKVMLFDWNRIAEKLFLAYEDELRDTF